ncbi:rootletin isoform X2 [Podarcis raffonei]|uniref:rootletin isoform X2 n=1 Tax=Podarcis raffonei TaxID=65483 RepID=UPI0023295489|nr:rootletin isoform X2 [Podarcis raffonei]
MKPAKVRIKDQPLYSSFNEKRKSKQGYEPGHMLLLPSAPTESVAQYSLALPSTNKDRVLDEMDVLKNITVHLNELVQTMEGVYANEEMKEEEAAAAAAAAAGEPTVPKEEHEDMTTFLICCSQLSNQLDCALREEKQILDSLLQWFEKEVREMEEIGEEEMIPDWQIPVADKNISNNITKLRNRIQKLEDLKGRIQELPKLIQLSAPKHEKKKPLSPVAPAPKDPKRIIEELAMKHATEDVMNMVQVFQDDTGQQTMESMNNRMLEIMKVFERQTNKLHRVSNEQDVLEGKLQKIQQEFRKLAEEKEIMEDELQKMKGSEQEKGVQDTRKKMLSKLEKEKAKVEEKPPQVIVEKPARPTPIPLKHKEAENQKMKEDLAKAQANIQTLEQEKKMLEEKLQKALEEAEMAKVHLAEVPPTIPDWQFPYTEIEDEKDVQKKGKKGTKPKGTDVQKLAVSAPETGKAGETFPAKDVKQKKKGSFIDMDKALSEGQEKEPEKRMEESRKTKAGKSEGADSKSAKTKDSAEIRKRRQTTKGAEKKTYGSPVSESSPSPPIEEKQLPALTKVVEETVSGTLDKSPEEVLPPDLKKRKTTSPELNVPEETRSLPTSEQEASSLLPEIEMEDAAQPKTIMRDTKRISAAISPEQASTLQKEIPQMYMDSSGLEEGGTKNLITKKMDQLANNLAELEGVPEAETLAKLLLEPSKGMELLSDEQKLQLLNQLIPPDGLQQLGKPEEEQTEQTRQLLSNVVSTLQLLQQAHVPEDGLSEEEMNEMTEKRRALLANLDTNLKVLQPAEAVRPGQQDIDNEINMLTEKGSHLRANLESNMRDLEEAQALAATQPSEMSENKVKELLQQRELLTADLEQNMQDLQTTKALAAVLEEKAKPEKGIDELSKERKVLLASLKSNMKELEEAETLAAAQPGSVSDKKIKELKEQRKVLAAHLEANQQDLQMAQASAPEPAEASKLQKKEIDELSKERKVLLASLKSNMKELEEAETLASTQPGSVSDKKIKELKEQRKVLAAHLEANLQDLQMAQPSASSIVGKSQLQEMKRSALSEKKKLLQEKLEANLKDLQEAETLAPLQSDSANEQRLQELSELRQHLTKELKDLEESMHDMQEMELQALQRTLFLIPSEKGLNELYELTEKKQLLLEKLASTKKELQETQELAATQPGSVSEHKLQELAEQKRHLTADLEATLDGIQNVYRRASERTVFVRPTERKVYELSEKKQELLEMLESNRKQLEAAQALAIAQPGSISDHKLQELIEQRRCLAAELDSTVHEMQKAQDSASEGFVFTAERELYELSAKKQELQQKLESNQKELLEAQALAVAEPGSISETKLQELANQNELLTKELEETVNDIAKVKHRVSERATLAGKSPERELYELSAKKQELQQKLESNQKELLEAQALAIAEPGSISETKLQELAEQKELLSKELEETVCDIEEAKDRVSERATLAGKPPDMELQQLLMKKEGLKEKLELNQRELEEAQALAAAEPGSISEHKLQLLTEQRKHLIADLRETVHDVKKAERRAAERTQQEPPIEMELYSLSIKKEMLQEMLEANQKELEEAQALAAAEPGSVSEHKLQELAEQRKKLTAELKATVYNIKKTQRRASQRAALEAPAERELFELAVKKQLLQANLESNWKELQEAQALAVAEPGSISEHKLQQLIEHRRHLTADLNETIHDMQNAERRVSEGAQLKPLPEIELYELSAKKELLQEKLESNQKELEAAQALAAAEPGSVNEHKLQELVEQRRNLTADLNATVSSIQKAQRRTSEALRFEPPVEKELFELAVKKQRLQANLESNWKELQEAQTLAATEPGSISEHKLQQLTEERRLMTQDLKETMNNMRNAERRASERALIETPTGRKFYDLLEKKQQLQADLESNWEKLQEAEALVATQPGIISEHKLEELTEERKRLTKELDATAEDILEAHRQASEKALFRKPAEKELYALSEKKQMLLQNLKGLQEAQALAATQSGIVGEEKRKQLAEQKQRLAADLEATMHDIQKAQRHVSVAPITVSLSENELYELSEKKSLILESLAFNRKQLQEAQALAALHPGTDSDHKLEELAQERKRLTEDLREAVHSLHEIQRRSSQKGQIDSAEEELEELAMKKTQLLQKLESNQRLLEEAEVLEAAQPGTINKHKLKEVAEERKRLTAELEEILHKMVLKDVQLQVSKPPEKELYKLSEWKQHLLDNLESNLKELEEAWALAATQPGPSSDNLLKKLNEERKTLIENLERVVEDSQKMKSRLSETGGVIRPIERDLSHLLQKKKLFLERLDSNLKNWLEAQTLAATQPSSINEKKFQHLTEQRRLLAAGLEAIIQDIQNIQDTDSEKQMKDREMALKQLHEKKKVFLENLRTNFRQLQEARALAAAEPGGISELKVQELIQQRRLLTAGLDAIMQSMQEIENLIAGNVKVAKPSEIEFDKIYEKRTLLLENMELNLQELKDLAKGGVSEKKIQAISEKRNRLVSSFEAILQNMEEALSLHQGARTRPDERNISDLIELSNLESKLDEMENLGVFSGFQLDTIRKKMCKLKEQKKKLISKWEKYFLKEYPEGYIPEPTKKDKTPKELARKGLFSYLRSSIKDLQEQGIIRQDSMSEVELDQLAKEERIVDRYFEEVPIEFLPSEVAALSTQYEDEKSLKRRALAAKLEANVRDLQSALQVDKLEKPKFEIPKSVLRTTGKRRLSSLEPSDQFALRPQLSGLQIHISKVPVANRIKRDSKTVDAGYDTTVQEEQDQLLKRDIELALKGRLLEEFPESKVSLPQLDSSSYLHANSHRLALEAAMQEILEFNKNLLPSHRTNLQQALHLASYQLQQKQLQQQHQANALVDKFRNMPLFPPPPPGTARFQDYTIPVQKSGWETNQLPQKDYFQKLALLKRRILGPEMKGGGPSSVTQGDVQDQVEDPIVISGKGCNPYRKETTFPVIKQSSKHK